MFSYFYDLCELLFSTFFNVSIFVDSDKFWPGGDVACAGVPSAGTRRAGNPYRSEVRYFVSLLLLSSHAVPYGLYS